MMPMVATQTLQWRGNTHNPTLMTRVWAGFETGPIGFEFFKIKLVLKKAVLTHTVYPSAKVESEWILFILELVSHLIRV